MSLIYDITTSLEANRGPVFSKHKYDVGSLIREVSGDVCENWHLSLSTVKRHDDTVTSFYLM